MSILRLMKAASNGLGPDEVANPSGDIIIGSHWNDTINMRNFVDLPNEPVFALAERCKNQGISRAEAVRRAVAEMLANQPTPSREEAFGSWKGKGPDSQAYVRKLREAWE